MDYKAEYERIISIISSTREMQQRHNQIMRDLVTFGTSAPYIYKEATLWQRFKWKLGNAYCRVRDAWWVLTGKAEITHAYDD